MKKLLFGNSVMLLGIAALVMTAMDVFPHIIAFWLAVALVFIGFIMAVGGYINGDGDPDTNKDDKDK